MLLKNEICVENYLNQKYPMLMVDEVLEYSGDFIEVQTSFIKDMKITNGQLSSWMLLEAAGQAAELMWRLNGVYGECYLAKCDNVWGLKSGSLYNKHEYIITAKKKVDFDNFYMTSVKLYYEQNECVSGYITHFFSKK